MAEHGIMIALPMGKGHKEPDGDEAYSEPDGDEGELDDHEYQMEADDVVAALGLKLDDAKKKQFAHALENFVRTCKG
jgi:hypothetical protein